MVCKVANTLKTMGVAKGDKVAIYMPVSPIAVATMLACTRIGAVHRYNILSLLVTMVTYCSVVFAGFSAEALSSRILDGM